jgi:hypothetical protein
MMKRGRWFAAAFAAALLACAPGKSTVLVGLNRPEIRPRSDTAVLPIEFQIGAGERRAAQAARTSDDTIELDERGSAELLAQAAEAASFAIHLPNGGEPDIALVFRPVGTKQAIGRLREACGRPAQPR